MRMQVRRTLHLKTAVGEHKFQHFPVFLKFSYVPLMPKNVIHDCLRFSHHRLMVHYGYLVHFSNCQCQNYSLRQSAIVEPSPVYLLCALRCQMNLFGAVLETALAEAERKVPTKSHQEPLKPTVCIYNPLVFTF